tara:strand:- start:132 stop:347 length:216 start_codon:yes stop_codon:yes gene_type:complete
LFNLSSLCSGRSRTAIEKCGRLLEEEEEEVEVDEEVEEVGTTDLEAFLLEGARKDFISTRHLTQSILQLEE